MSMTAKEFWRERYAIPSDTEMCDFAEAYVAYVLAAKEQPGPCRAETMMGVYCNGNNKYLPIPIKWDGWQRLADYMNAILAEQKGENNG